MKTQTQTRGLNFGITEHKPSHAPASHFQTPDPLHLPAGGIGLGNASAPFRFSIGQEGKGCGTQPEISNDELEEEMERTEA